MTKLFPNQKPNETVLYVIRKHWVSYVPHLIFAVAVLILFISVTSFIFLNLFDTSKLAIEGATVLFSIVLLSALFLMLYGFVDHYLDVLIITNERLIDMKQHGFFHQETKEIHLLDIENVNANVEGPFGVYLKYGDLTIKTGHDEIQTITINSIPRASKVARMIMELHTQHIAHPNLAPILTDQNLDSGLGGGIIEDKPEHSKDRESSSYWANLYKK